MTVHDFQRSLAKSHGYAGASWWNEVYAAAFPTLTAAVYVAKDGWAQRAGIDRRLVLGDGSTLTVDEKVRDENWPDFLLERWSDRARGAAGWVQKDLVCDYLAYAFVPTAECYLLPFRTMQHAWRRHGKRWIALAEDGEWVSPHYKRGRDGFGIVHAENHGWVTESVAVPRDALLSALTDVMRVTWTQGEVAA